MKIPQETADKKYNWYLYTVAFEGGRDAVKDSLAKENIGATVYYSPPVHKTPFYKQMAPGTKLGQTEWAADHVLSLPIHPHVTEGDITRIAEATAKAAGH